MYFPGELSEEEEEESEDGDPFEDPLDAFAAQSPMPKKPEPPRKDIPCEPKEAREECWRQTSATKPLRKN